MTEAPLLRVVGLQKTFESGHFSLRRRSDPSYAVRDVSFDLNAGETLAIVGESGAGKSTLGRLVLRLVEPDAGSILIEGRDIRELGRGPLRSLRKRVQMIFQDPYSSLDPRMSVEDSVAEPLTIHFNMGSAERHRKVLEVLDRVGIGARQASRYPHEFSGGQLQRIAIARALAVEPDLIVCDEPVAALDMSIRAQVINLLADLQEERGVSYLFISHDLSLVRHFADRIAVMYRGEIVEVASSEELYTDPKHPYSRDLLKVIPVPDPRLYRPAEAQRSRERNYSDSSSSVKRDDIGKGPESPPDYRLSEASPASPQKKL